MAKKQVDLEMLRSWASSLKAMTKEDMPKWMRQTNKSLYKREVIRDWMKARKDIWPDFVNLRSELVKQGVDRNTAHYVAAAQFPPPAEQTLEEGTLPGVLHPPQRTPKEARTLQMVKAEEFVGRKCSPAHALDWVFEKMSIVDVKPKDAPSEGAWGLLQWARTEGRSDFYRAYMSRRLPAKSAQDSEVYSDEDQNLDFIEEVKRASVG